MKNKRVLFSIFISTILLISSCGEKEKCSDFNSKASDQAFDFSVKSDNSNGKNTDESKSGYYYCDFKDETYYYGNLEHKYYIYTNLVSEDNTSVSFNKSGNLDFKLTFYHQLQYDFVKKHRRITTSFYGPISFQYRFKNDQNYQGITFDIEDGETMYKKRFRNTIVEKFCEHEEKDYTIDVSISIEKLLEDCNYQSTPVYIIPCFTSYEDGYSYTDGVKDKLLEVVDGVDASFYLDVNDESISIRNMN